MRAGANGENESLALDRSIALIGWAGLGDVSGFQTREALMDAYRVRWPETSANSLANQASQVWRFRTTIAVGDLVVLPLKTRPQVAIGRVTGPYTFAPDLVDGDACHTRPVQWLKEVPRSAFQQDLLYTLGAFMTVFKVSRNNAEERINAFLAGAVPHEPAVTQPAGDSEGEEAPLDIEAFSHDVIQQRILQKFKGHGMARLVGELLRVEGYTVQVSQPGADGGWISSPGRARWGSIRRGLVYRSSQAITPPM